MISVLFGLLACDLVIGWEPVTLMDEGTSCLEAALADSTGTVTVDPGICLSSSCDRNATGTCEATLDGATITIQSGFAWETATGPVGCTDDCGLLMATCDVGPLPAGTYTLVHGSETVTVDVPTTETCEWWF